MTMGGVYYLVQKSNSTMIKHQQDEWEWRESDLRHKQKEREQRKSNETKNKTERIVKRQQRADNGKTCVETISEI